VNRVSAADFERIYADDPDPWQLASSQYERRKRAATLAALGSGFFRRGLEIGCGPGLLTSALATRCESVLAIDFAPRAVEIATRRLADVRSVEVRLASFPEQVPAGPWSAVVCSEVLYYLDPPALDRAIAWLAAELAGGATVVAVHWRGPGLTEPLRGDAVHDRLQADLARWHAGGDRRARYRLDRFEGDNSAT
jgi:SAM-dependent methyltransferase